MAMAEALAALRDMNEVDEPDVLAHLCEHLEREVEQQQHGGAGGTWRAQIGEEILGRGARREVTPCTSHPL
jgi:hypothetical protein